MNDDRQAAFRAGITAIWVKSLPYTRELLDTLEAVTAALRNNTLSAEQRRAGVRAAHRLAGSAGTFGFHDGSTMARELEVILQTTGDIDVSRVAELVAALRNLLDTEELPK